MGNSVSVLSRMRLKKSLRGALRGGGRATGSHASRMTAVFPKHPTAAFSRLSLDWCSVLNSPSQRTTDFNAELI